MAQFGRKTIKIEAPIVITTNKIAVWMDEGRWASDFFKWLQKNKLHNKIAGLQHMHNKIKITFISPKDCTEFGLKYASRNK